LLTAALRALHGGGQAGRELALSIIDDYIVTGLEPSSKVTIKLDLNFQLLDAVLSTFESAKRPEAIKRLVNTLRVPSHLQRSVVTSGAMQYLLRALAEEKDTEGILRTIDWMLREAGVPGRLEVEPGSSAWSLAFRTCLATQDWSTTKQLTKRLAATMKKGRLIDAETIYMVLKAAYELKPEDEQSHERQVRQALDAVHYVIHLWPKNIGELHEEYAKVNPSRTERRLVFQNALGDLVKRLLDEFDGLHNVPAFHDLTCRLEELHTALPKNITDRYKNDV
jgi:hypothetical protein